MSDKPHRLIYSQTELLQLFQEQLKSQFNAKLPYEPNSLDADYQLHVTNSWFDTEYWDDYSVNPKLRTTFTLRGLTNHEFNGKSVVFTFDHNKDYENDFTYENGLDPFYNILPENRIPSNEVEEPFDVVININDTGEELIRSPFGSKSNHKALRTPGENPIDESYFTDYLKPLFFKYPEKLKQHLPNFTLLYTPAYAYEHAWNNPDGSKDDYVPSIQYKLSQANFKQLEYYQKPLEVYVPLNDTDTILFKDNHLSTDGTPTVFSFNIHNPSELKTLNDKLVEVSNRITPAQEEIMYQIAENNHWYDPDNPKLKHMEIKATLPDNLLQTNTVQVDVTHKDKTQQFFVTRINDDQYRITETFDPQNMPDSIEVYNIINRTKDEGYSKTLGNTLKRIVYSNQQPKSTIKVAKQRPKTKFKQTSLFDEPETDNGPSLD
mgnify:CR=1 FL=1|jgi:hypothetical protein